MSSPKADTQAALADLMAECADDPLLFAREAFDWGYGDLADQQLEDWQVDVFASMGEQLQNPTGLPIRIGIRSGHGVGKSALTSISILWAMATAIDARGYVTANTENQLRTKTWPTLAEWRRRCVVGGWFVQTSTSIAIADPRHRDTWRIDAIPWQEQKTEAFAGLHNRGRRVLVAVDEGSNVPDPVYEVIEGALTDDETQIVYLVLGNPTRNTGRFHRIHTKDRAFWTTRRVDSRGVRITNKGLIDQWIEAEGIDSDFVRVRVLGDFPSASSAQFFPSDKIRAAAERTVDVTPADPIVLGVDVARQGGDRSVIAERRGFDCRSWAWDVLREADSMQLVARIVDRAHRIRSEVGRFPDAIFVDATGVGGPVADRLRQMLMEVSVFDVVFGERATGLVEGRRVLNKRAEIHARALAALGYIALEDDRDLIEEMEAIEFSYAADQASLKILDKDRIRETLGRSPDLVDALCLLFTMPVEGKTGTENRASEHRGDWFEEWRPS